MSMGWLVLNWGERWGTSGMGRVDGCAALRNANGVVSSDFLEGHAAVDGLCGPRDLYSGLLGSGLGQLLCSRLF
jgi:hypothetical protein